MNRNFSFPAVPLLRKRQIGLAEIESMLDAFPQPAILLNFEHNRFLLANARVAELTAYTRSEIVALEPPQLFPGIVTWSDESFAHPGNQSFSETLVTRNSISLEVDLSLHRLNQGNAWGLAIFEPSTLRLQQADERERQLNRLADLLALAESLSETDASQALNRLLEATQHLTGAENLAIYVLQAAEPGLKKAASLEPDAVLPENLSPTAFKALAEPVTWMPGKRASTELQKAARVAHMAYLVSLPLGEPEAIIGLVVIAARTGKLPDDYLALLKVVAATASGILQQITLYDQISANEEILERSLLIGNSLKDTSLEGAIILTPDLTIEELNPAAESLLGYATREVVGQPVTTVLIGPNNLIPALQSAQQGISTPNLGDVRLHRRDGIAFLAHVSTQPLMRNEHLEGVLVLLRDLSEHEQYQIRNQQLEQRALLGEVNAIFAHEVRNPINNISTGLQLMAMNLPPDDPNQELLGRISQDCNRLTQLMNSILAFSRPPENKTELIDLGDLLKNLIDRWRPRLARLNVKHSVKVSTRHPNVEGDPRALEQVFSNLIGNAVEAMGKQGGTLTINIRPSASVGSREQVEVNVIDDGPGIPEEIHDRIFEPFFTTNRNGTGLGLAIAKRIVTAHKGTIALSSVPGGTAFQVILPVAQNTEAQEQNGPNHSDR